MVQNNPFKNDRQNLVRAVLNSAEFHTKNKGLYQLIRPILIISIRIRLPLYNCQKPEVRPSGTYSPNAFPKKIFARNYLTPYIPILPHSWRNMTSLPATSIIFRCVLSQGNGSVASQLREPCQRLISAYRYGRAHPPSGEFADDLGIKLANELTAEEFFEHEYVISSTWTNNAYLFFFGSSLEDRVTLEALVKAHPASGASPADDPAALNSLADDNVAVEILARAVQRILDLDGIGLTERFKESVQIIFPSIGLPVPEQIVPAMVTDELPDRDVRFSPVPPVEMTARLWRALQPLTKYDRIIYNTAKREFERRHAAAQAGLAAVA